MTETKRSNGLIIGLIVVLLVLIAVAVSLFLATNVLIEWHPYPKDAQVLNLRGQEITVEHYEKLRSQFPEAEIYWDVPVGQERYPENTRELTLSSITEEQIEMLAYLEQLEVIHAEQCKDQEMLAKLRQTLPDCVVCSNVTVDGKEWSWDVEEMEIASLTEEEVAVLAQLPQLKTVHAESCTDYAQLADLQQRRPECQVEYSVVIAEQEFSVDAVSIEVQNAEAEQLQERLQYLPQVTQVHLIDPASDGQSLLQLRQLREDITFTWELDFCGVTLSDADTEVDISGTQPESLEQVAAAMEYLPNAEKLIMTDCGFENEAMAAFRESKREDYKVVWTVMCGTIPVRTDEIYFHPIQEGVYYFFDEDAYNLRYCEDMICVDVGHMSLHDISWVEYMPNLKYLILCLTTVLDITPLSTCKNLIFLELDMTGIKDYTPLLGCTALEDLNLGMTYGDPTPIAQMTWLKNLWWKGKGYETQTMLREALPDTNMNFTSKATSGGGWRKLQNYYDMRDILGMHYMN